MEEGDIIHINIPNRELKIIGIKGKKLNANEIDKILKERKKIWKAPVSKENTGSLAIYKKLAVS